MTPVLLKSLYYFLSRDFILDVESHFDVKMFELFLVERVLPLLHDTRFFIGLDPNELRRKYFTSVELERLDLSCF